MAKKDLTEPKGRKSDLTRERILERATAEFAARGFEGARVQMIAREAQINKERLYAYFQSKEGLYQAVVNRAYDRLVAAEEPLLAAGPQAPDNLSATLVSLYFDFHRKHPEFSRILAWTNLESTPAGEDFHHRRNKILAHLEKWYASAQSKGSFKTEVSFETYFFTISAFSFFYFANQKTMGFTLGRDLSKPQVTRDFINGFLSLIHQPAQTDL